MRRTFLGLLLIASLTTAPPAALAQAPEQERPDTSREMLEDATRKILDAFELMLRAIPQYEAPEILDNGDIIIRRRPPRPEQPAPPPGKDGPTKTST
ncbi:MAG: hypothetical protein ACE5GT_05730 [Rhodospirillales bacterium]